MREEEEPHSIGGLLTTLAPLTLLPFGRYFLQDAVPVWFGWPVPAWMPTTLAAAAVSATLLGGALLPPSPAAGRVIATVGVAAAAGLTVLAGPGEPLRGFAALLAAWALLTRIWPPDRTLRPVPPAEAATRVAARTAALTALAGWTIAVPGEWGHAWIDALAAGVALVLAGARGIAWAAIHARSGGRALVPSVLLHAIGLVVAVAAAWKGAPLSALTALVVGPAFTLVATRTVAPPQVGRAAHTASLWQAVIDHPARLLAVTFAALSLIGGVLLDLPAAASGPEDIPFVDALFTAVSAACVTGLAVNDPSRAFSGVGQGILLLLIQLGGLGIMTVSTATLGLLGRRMRLRHEGAMADLLGAEGRGSLYRMLRLVLGVTVVAEACGAAVLSTLLVARGVPVGEAVWKGVFTAVSAFCNAGFALWSDSLVGFQEDPLFLHVVAALVVLGGLGTVPIVGAMELLRGRRVSLQTKLVLATSAALLAGGTLALLALEWSGALGHLRWPDRLTNAWFHTVVLRTAGFNALDMADFGPASITLMLLSMFVGGSPASMAGGVKVTTLAILGLAVVAAVRGRAEATAFGRTIPHAAVYRAAAIVTVGFLVVAAALVALQVTQRMPSGMATFEVVSALGTVGLSIGGTARLDDVGKTIVMACMFLGRIGPLTMFLLLGERRPEAGVRLPSEGVATG